MAISIRADFSHALNQLLTTGDDADRCYAARAAARATALETLPALLDCLYHEDPDVGVDAADALAQLANEAQGRSLAHIDEMITRLVTMVEQHPEGDARTAAARALAQLDDERALQALLNWALGNPQQFDGVNDWDDWWDIQLSAVQALGLRGRAEAVPVLSQLLEDDLLDIESDLLRALVLCGDEGVVHVITLLDAPNARLVRRAAQALRFASCDRSLVAQFHQLRHPDASVRAAVAESLRARDARRYFIDLVELLRDVDGEVRCQALQAARGMLENLEAYHLKHISIDKLLRLLAEHDAEGRALILNALRFLLDRSSSVLAGADSVSDIDRSFEIDSVSETDNPSLTETLLNALQSNHAVEVEAAANLLVVYPVSQARELLLQRIQDEALPLSSRRQLLKTVQQVGRNRPDYLQPLVALLQSGNAALRQIVMDVLASLAQLPADCAPSADEASLAAQPLLQRYLNGEVLTADMFAEPAEHDTAIPDNRIATVQVDANGDPELPPTPAHPEQSEEERIRSLMARFGEPVSDRVAAGEQVGDSVDRPTAPHSTLDAIHRSNVENALHVHKPDDDRGEHIRDMVAQLPEEMNEFSHIVTGHLDQGERLKLSRRKIAPLPDYSNRVLAARALGNHATEQAVEQLLALLLEADPYLVQEAVSSLSRIAGKNNTLTALESAVGPLSTLLLGGTAEIRLYSARALGLLGKRTALPVLKEALRDGDSNVRIEAIRALQVLFTGVSSSEYAQGAPDEHVSGKYISGKQIPGKLAPVSVVLAVLDCLDDDTDGVVLAAIDFLVCQQLTDCVPQLVDAGLRNSALTEKAASACSQLNAAEAAQRLLTPLLDAEFASQRPAALQMLSTLAPMFQDEHEQKTA